MLQNKRKRTTNTTNISFTQIQADFSSVSSSNIPQNTYFLRSKQMTIKPHRNSTQTISIGKKSKPKKKKSDINTTKKTKQNKSKPKSKPKDKVSSTNTNKKAKKDKPQKKASSSKKEKKYTMMTSKTKIANENCENFLKGKCPNLFCDKIHNFSLLYQKQNNLLFNTNFSYLKTDFSLLLPYQHKLFSNQQLDLMFLVDCTGSMSPWINQVKKELSTIMTYITTNNPFADIKISFVGYRDIRDFTRFEIQDFTSDITSLEQFISKVIAMGGNDTPEDIAGALNKSLAMSWREKSAKYLVLIADAPCHGTKYHTWDDDYPKGDPNGLNPEELIAEIAKKNITLYAIKIKTYTDQMFDIFNKVYVAESVNKTPIVYANLGTSTDQLGFLVAVSSNSTLNQMTVDNLPLNDLLNELEKEKLDNDEFNKQFNNFITRIKNSQTVINYNSDGNETKKFITTIDTSRTFDTFMSLSSNFKPFKALCHSFVIKKDRHTNINWENPFISHNTIETEALIDNIAFNEGAQRYALYLYDNKLEMKFVAKRNKVSSPNFETIKYLSKELETITICHHIANAFNERVIALLPDQKTDILFNFIHCYIYEDIENKTLYCVENYIPGDYVKYNNNAGWISNSIADQTLLAQAFSHFSYQYSQGYLIIVDLQGVAGYLTDPQIHCLNGNKFGQGNLGYLGIVRFFLTHRCNKYCKELGLIHPNEGSHTNIDIDKFDFFVDKYIPPDDENKLINKLCDLCRKPFKKKAGEIFELKKKCWECFCESCDEKRKKSFKGAKCEKCGKFYMSSQYLFKMKRLPFPKKCMACIQETMNEERNKFYKELFENDKSNNDNDHNNINN